MSHTWLPPELWNHVIRVGDLDPKVVSTLRATCRAWRNTIPLSPSLLRFMFEHAVGRLIAEFDVTSDKGPSDTDVQLLMGIVEQEKFQLNTMRFPRARWHAGAPWRPLEAIETVINRCERQAARTRNQLLQIKQSLLRRGYSKAMTCKAENGMAAMVEAGRMFAHERIGDEFESFEEVAALHVLVQRPSLRQLRAVGMSLLQSPSSVALHLAASDLPPWEDGSANKQMLEVFSKICTGLYKGDLHAQRRKECAVIRILFDFSFQTGSSATLPDPFRLRAHDMFLWSVELNLVGAAAALLALDVK